MSASAAELLRTAEGRAVVNEDGNEETIRLLPPLSVEELAAARGADSLPTPGRRTGVAPVSLGASRGARSSRIDFSGLTEPIFEESLPLWLAGGP